MGKSFLIKYSSIPILSCMVLTSSTGKPKSPNLIFIFPDQMRGQAMGFLGEEKVKTPVFDKSASESVYFSNAFRTYKTCI